MALGQFIVYCLFFDLEKARKSRKVPEVADLTIDAEVVGGCGVVRIEGDFFANQKSSLSFDGKVLKSLTIFTS